MRSHRPFLYVTFAWVNLHENSTQGSCQTKIELIKKLMKIWHFVLTSNHKRPWQISAFFWKKISQQPCRKCPWMNWLNTWPSNLLTSICFPLLLQGCVNGTNQTTIKTFLAATAGLLCSDAHHCIKLCNEMHAVALLVSFQSLWLQSIA